MAATRTPLYPGLVSPRLVFPSIHMSMENIGNSGVGAGATWPAANLAIYHPFALPSDALLTGVKFNCTSGNSAGRNFDLGIFDASGVKLFSSGATLVAAGVNTWAPNQWLQGGVPYYLGMYANNGSLQFWRKSSSVVFERSNGILQEATGAANLPATATFAAVTSNNYVPVVFFTFGNVSP